MFVDGLMVWASMLKLTSGRFHDIRLKYEVYIQYKNEVTSRGEICTVLKQQFRLGELGEEFEKSQW